VDVLDGPMGRWSGVRHARQMRGSHGLLLLGRTCAVRLREILARIVLDRSRRCLWGKLIATGLIRRRGCGVIREGVEGHRRSAGGDRGPRGEVRLVCRGGNTEDAEGDAILLS